MDRGLAGYTVHGVTKGGHDKANLAHTHAHSGRGGFAGESGNRICDWGRHGREQRTETRRGVPPPGIGAGQRGHSGAVGNAGSEFPSHTRWECHVMETQGLYR